MKSALAALGLLVVLITGHDLRAEEFSRKDRDLAIATLEALGVPRQIEQARMRVIAQQVQNNGLLKDMEPVLQGFYEKYFAFDALKNDLAVIYLNRFSAEELETIRRFCESPAGRKLIMERLELDRQLAKLASDEATKHKGELDEQIFQLLDQRAESQAAPPGQP